MSDKKYYVVCETGCMVEGMTAEQILEAIATATGNAVVPKDKAYITMVVDQNTGNNLKLWRGTRAQFNAIEELASDVYYIITDDHTPNEAYAKATAALTVANDAAAELARVLGGCWIEFTDEEGNPTDEPHIHWMQEV